MTPDELNELIKLAEYKRLRDNDEWRREGKGIRGIGGSIQGDQERLAEIRLELSMSKGTIDREALERFSPPPSDFDFEADEELEEEVSEFVANLLSHAPPSEWPEILRDYRAGNFDEQVSEILDEL